MAFLSSSRAVLIFGDEGLQIYNVGRLGARFVEFLAWNQDDFEGSLRHLLVKKCKRKSVLIINDMVEQHYRKERVPKVAIMDRANVLKRRLNMAFPNYKVRAALKLDDKKSGLPQDVKGGAYLFAAIPSVDGLNKTIRVIQAASISIVGLYLLPIEASAMVKALSSKASVKGARTKAAWTIFMGQHQSGGVRQIVTRSGELALTRMSPIVDTDVEPELWAKEMAAELTATMSYLTRFGYQENDGLNIIVIGNENVSEHLHTAINVECNLQVLTSQQAGKILGVNVGQQNDSRYADPLHAAYLGQKSKFRLPMQVAAIESRAKPRRIASLVAFGLLCACGYVGYQAFTSWSKSQEVAGEYRVSAERQKSVKQDFDLEVAKKKEVGFDFVLVSNSVEIFNDLESQKIEPLPFLKEVGQSLEVDLHLDKINVKSKKIKTKKTNADPYNNVVPGSEAEETVIEAVLALSIDGSIDPDVGVRKINTLQERLQQRLPEYEVEIIKQIADLSYTGSFVGESGDGYAGQDEKEPEDYKAEIIIKGGVR